MQILDNVSCLRNCLEFSQPSSCVDEANMLTRKMCSIAYLQLCFTQFNNACFAKVLLLCREGRAESDDKGLVCYYSIKAYRVFSILQLNKKYWASPGLNSIRWLELFTNRTFRKHRKLIFPHRDFVICIVSMAIFHSAFCHPHFSIHHPPPSGDPILDLCLRKILTGKSRDYRDIVFEKLRFQNVFR